MKKIRVGVAGAAGYTGGELIRIIMNHPRAELVSLFSRSNANKPLHSVHQDLVGETSLQFSDSVHRDIDVLFLCMGHGESHRFLEDNRVDDNVRIIDLSNDFRLAINSSVASRKFVDRKSVV